MIGEGVMETSGLTFEGEDARFEAEDEVSDVLGELEVGMSEATLDGGIDILLHQFDRLVKVGWDLLG